MTIQTKATEQYLLVVLFIMVVLVQAFEYVDEILKPYSSSNPEQRVLAPLFVVLY